MARYSLTRMHTSGRPALTCAGLPGVRIPETIIGIGHNYRSIGNAVTPVPVVFGKFSGSVVADGVPICIPEEIDGPIVCEGELAVVVGRSARSLRTRDEALACVAGVTVANDVSARGLQDADVQSTRGKSLDTFCPIGPELVTLDEVADLGALTLETRIGGRLVQSSTTAKMVLDVAELVLYVSRFATLYPGDVILTGTPAEQHDDDLALRPGDVVEVAIEGVGILTNPVVACPAPVLCPGPHRTA